jgi:hypothetical protein
MAGLIETLIRPDREENPDRAEIVKAANLLQIGEFQFLQVAYRDRFGEDLPEAEINAMFDRFIVKGLSPGWARNYARQILDWDRRDLLDDRDPAFHRYDSEYYKLKALGARRLAFAVIFLALTIGGGMVLSHFTANKGTSVLPPYFDEKELPQEHVPAELRGS